MSSTIFVVKRVEDTFDIIPWTDEEHRPLMECGHTAMSIMTTFPGNKQDPLQAAAMDEQGHISIHSCVICDCKVIGVKVLLEGRMAKCASCKNTRPSSYDLAFFEYKGPGSHRAGNMCKHCWYAKLPHDNGKITDHVFKPHGPYEQDEYYCGCQGWD
jgi:hypothetical protein